MSQIKYCLVVHNSDEVKAVIVGNSIEEIMDRVRNTTYGQDIEDRSLEYYNDDMREEAEEKDEGWVDAEEIPKDYLIKNAKLLLSRLDHDGDSEDGYTLFATDLGHQAVWFFREFASIF